VAAMKGIIPIPQGREIQEARRGNDDVDKIREVISNLIVEGVLMWGHDRHQPEPPFLSITGYGKEVLNNGKIIPHDPDVYLKAFKDEVPDADHLMILYLTESLQTFRHNNLLSSSVMLGVASEAAFNVLFDAIKNALTIPDKIKKFEKLECEISTKKIFDAAMDEINLVKRRLPNEIKENIETIMQGIFNLIRLQRNDSGHPTGKVVTRSLMFANLHLFIMYCSHLYALVKWLEENQL
jgi:hypothetical protein